MTVSIKVIRLGETNTKPSRVKATCENGRTVTMSCEACTNEKGDVDLNIVVRKLLKTNYNQLIAYEHVAFKDATYFSTCPRHYETINMSATKCDTLS